METRSPRRSRAARIAWGLGGRMTLAAALGVLGVLGSSPLAALGAGSLPAPIRPPASQALDPAGLLDAIRRGELPSEALVIVAAAAVVVGILLTLIVAVVRGRRRRTRELPTAPAPAPLAVDPSSELPPSQGAGSYHAAILRGPETFGERPADPDPATGPSPEWRTTRPPLEGVALSVAADASAGLGTTRAPLVVELLEERRGAVSRPNLAVLIAVATVAVGIAFAGGAIVGALLGTTLGATIGFAFAGGAGTAIVVTTLVLRAHRR